MWNSHRPVNNSLSHPKEKKLFWQLVHQIEQELCQVQNRVNHHRKSCDLFEIFCGPSSQLTHQAQQLGMTAHRFGKEQCDLQSLEGREFLFTQLVTYRPRHLWYSPECGPWCSWSQLIAHCPWNPLIEFTSNEEIICTVSGGIGFGLVSSSVPRRQSFSLGTTSEVPDVQACMATTGFVIHLGR